MNITKSLAYDQTKLIKQFVKALLLYIRWFVCYFLKSPRLESYIYKRNKENIIFFKQVQNDRVNKSDIHLRPYYPHSIPNVVWIYWAQGEDQAPLVVQKCIESWKVKNPSWQIIVLNENTIDEYVKIPKMSSKHPIRYKANLLRLMLLKEYGGVWADATTFAHRPLNEWLPLLANSGIFMFNNPSKDRDIENWFIAAEKNNPLINEWEYQLRKYYLAHQNEHPAYFLAFYIYQWMLTNNTHLKALHRSSSSLTAGQCFIMKSVINDHTNLNTLLALIESGLPVSKLDWRIEISNTEFLRLIQKLERGRPYY